LWDESPGGNAINGTSCFVLSVIKIEKNKTFAKERFYIWKTICKKSFTFLRDDKTNKEYLDANLIV